VSQKRRAMSPICESKEDCRVTHIFAPRPKSWTKTEIIWLKGTPRHIVNMRSTRKPRVTDIVALRQEEEMTNTNHFNNKPSASAKIQLNIPPILFGKCVPQKTTAELRILVPTTGRVGQKQELLPLGRLSKKTVTKLFIEARL